MIWIWIAAAAVLSCLLLRKKKISIENYIWVLLPIDMYGFTAAGVTIKPYMFLGLLLFITLFMRYNGRLFVGDRGAAAIIPFLLGAFVVNMFNGGDRTSIMSVLMMMMVYFIACVYASHLNTENIGEIPDVIVAASVGYGIVFIVAYALAIAGVNIGGVSTTIRSAPGILMRFSNMYGGSLIQNYRLRGFNIDPNTSVGVFISAFSIDMIMMMLRKKKDKIYPVSLLVCLLCIILTNSRMGILAALIVMFITGVYIIRNLPERQKKLVIIQLLIILALLVAAAVISGKSARIFARLSSIYGNRSGFNDEYGRGSIWKNAIEIWIEHGLFFGIGFARMQFMTATGRVCHNTWLEILSSCGLIIGGLIILYFAVVILNGIFKKRTLTQDESILHQALLTGLVGVCWCLLTVDNITNSYLWFFTVTMLREMALVDEKKVLDGKAA